MKFPYGICDFNKIMTRGYFYCERTDRIPVLEETGDSILFLRPHDIYFSDYEGINSIFKAYGGNYKIPIFKET